jgi:heme oxygenase
MSLRDLTHEAHQNAERQEFVKILMSGNISKWDYAAFLKNLHPQYEILEACAMAKGLLNGMPDARRAPAILKDYMELNPDGMPEPRILPVVDRYMKHILSIKDNAHKLMAHIYVRHMGDLAGGQMIAKKVPGSGYFYQFTDPDALKVAIREKIDDDMAEEATICFNFAADLMKEMMEHVIEK